MNTKRLANEKAIVQLRNITQEQTKWIIKPFFSIPPCFFSFSFTWIWPLNVTLFSYKVWRWISCLFVFNYFSGFSSLLPCWCLLPFYAVFTSVTLRHVMALLSSLYPPPSVFSPELVHCTCTSINTVCCTSTTIILILFRRKSGSMPLFLCLLPYKMLCQSSHVGYDASGTNGTNLCHHFLKCFLSLSIFSGFTRANLNTRQRSEPGLPELQGSRI